MKNQAGLFDEEPRYCIDTNVLVSFLRGTDDEHYGADVFAPQWAHIERLIASGAIIAPRQVQRELEKWCKTIPVLKGWLRRNKHMVRDVETEAQLRSAKKIVNAYSAYADSMNYLGDLEVMTLADALGITVISLESENPQSSQRRPKIPNICKQFGINCVSLPGFLRREKFGQVGQ